MNGKKIGETLKISGPLVVAKGMARAEMFDLAWVSEERLTGEIIEMHGDLAYIQMYEETSGLKPGQPVYFANKPLSIDLGPGLLGSIFDGIGRPLARIKELSGDRIDRGIQVSSLDEQKNWDFQPTAKVGDMVETGDIIGTIQETRSIVHHVMVPHGVKGLLVRISGGPKTTTDVVAVIQTESGEKYDVKMGQAWPIRKKRAYKEKHVPFEPMVTGQRVIDTLFPIAKGGTAAVPGPYGSGKTVVQHQLAKWADTDVVVYIGCGERGNEMTDVLNEFPKLIDPKTGFSLMERTVLIANTSDMPVAAREASIYTGITIAEYYRDMGYSVSVMADSTSRWAEALREMTSRLEEMPGEEGYPAYLGSRLTHFYERAGVVTCLSSDAQKRRGAITAIGAVSPPGGDMSDPVVQATLRIVKVFWQLDSALAYQRHFPAINWLNSYSLYQSRMDTWIEETMYSDWTTYRQEAVQILQEEAALKEMITLIGMDSLSDHHRLQYEVARLIREDFLHQNSFDEADTYTHLEKQCLMLTLILDYYHEASRALQRGVRLETVLNSVVVEWMGRLKVVEMDQLQGTKEKFREQLDKDFNTEEL